MFVGLNAVAIGLQAGWSAQRQNAIAIGVTAGGQSQGTNAVAIGFNTGGHSQGSGAIAIGANAAQSNQGVNAIAIGIEAGQTNQGVNAIAIGRLAGLSNQIQEAIAIGLQAGRSAQKRGAIAIGTSAGLFSQGTNAVAIGTTAGAASQGSGAIAMGIAAASQGQRANAIAIGVQAGQVAQGADAIAIGRLAGNLNQANNSIVISAVGAVVAGTAASACYIAPMRAITTGNVLYYNTTSFEVSYGAPKTFVIDHPRDPSRHLVHACLEGPEAGVYYRGKSEIPASATHTVITLPDYADALATDFTVQVTPIYEGDAVDAYPRPHRATEVTNGAFTVHGPPGRFFWHVYGSRQSIEVEPLRSSVHVKGSGPYRWI